MLTPYLNKITLGDSLPILRSFPDNAVDLILTDPPYGIGADKGQADFGIMEGRRYAGDWDKSRPSPECFAELLRVGKKLIIFGGNYFADLLPPSKCWLVWDKIGEYRFQNPFADVELAWSNFTHASRKYTCIQQGFIKQSTDTRIHPTQKPLKLISAILQDHASAGQTVLDPFSGSGTTAIACHTLGLNFIAIERDPHYHAESLKRLDAHRSQLLLPL